MSGGAIVPFPKSAVTVADARSAVARARERVAKSLLELEHDMGGADRIRDAVRKHPMLTVGGAFLVGYALARVLYRSPLD